MSRASPAKRQKVDANSVDASYLNHRQQISDLKHKYNHGMFEGWPQYDATLGDAGGRWCKICDATSKGPWTRNLPNVNGRKSSLEQHALSDRHFNRVPPSQQKYYPQHHKRQMARAQRRASNALTAVPPAVNTININNVQDHSTALRFALNQSAHSNSHSVVENTNIVAQPVSIQTAAPNHKDTTSTNECSGNDTTTSLPPAVVPKGDGFHGLMSKMHLIFMSVQKGMSMQHVAEYSNFISTTCSGQISTTYNGANDVDDMIYAMNAVQVKRDRARYKECDDLSLTVDGASWKHRSHKVIADRMWVPGLGPKFHFGVLVSPIKRVNSPLVQSDADLETVDSAVDVVATLDSAVVNHYRKTWKSVNQLCLDGASQNMGKKGGAIAVVC